MAYVPSFGNIDDAFDDKDPIEGQEAPLSSGASSQGGTQPSQGGNQNNYTQSNYASGKKIIQKAAQDPLNLQFGKTYTDEIEAANRKLDEGYAKNQEDYNRALDSYRIDADEFSRGISGEDGGTLKSFLAKDYSNGAADSTYQPFKAEKLSFDPNQFSQLGTSVGLQGELSKAQQAAGKYNYTRGQAALDSIIYGSSPEARNQIKNLGDASRDYVGRAISSEEASKHNLAALPGTAQSEQARVRAEIEKLVSGITNEATQNAANINKDARSSAKIDMMDPRVQALLQDVLAQYSTDNVKSTDTILASLFGKQDPDSKMPMTQQEYIRKAIEGVSNQPGFVSGDGVKGPAYTKEQAMQFNNLMSLLGSDEAATEYAGGNPYSTNYKALGDALNSAASEAQKTYGTAAEWQDKLNAAKSDIKTMIEMEMGGGLLGSPVDMSKFAELNKNIKELGGINPYKELEKYAQSYRDQKVLTSLKPQEAKAVQQLQKENGWSLTKSAAVYRQDQKVQQLSQPGPWGSDEKKRLRDLQTAKTTLYQLQQRDF